MHSNQIIMVYRMTAPASLAPFLVWTSIALCVTQSAIFSGLNLAIFSVSKLRLEVDAAGGNLDAIRVLDLRKDSNFTLSTIVWGNVVTNVLLTLLSNSILTGLGAFVFSTFAITVFGDIVPQAYFSRNALKMAARLRPLLGFYKVVLSPVAKPTAALLNWWLGPEGITLLRERDFRALLTRHGGREGADVGQLEAIGALNFLDLDDIPVLEEGELIDPLSIVAFPNISQRPALPRFERSPTDPFLRRLDASRKKWVIIIDDSGQPGWVLDADQFLRDALFKEAALDLEVYWHRPVIVSDMNARLGDVIGRMKVRPNHPEDDVIDNDLILVWGEQKRIITGSDLLGRLLRGISIKEVKPD
jgi:metal transporter CNNM